MVRSWKIYGKLQHRQRESFNNSYTLNLGDGENVCKIEVENSDKTGTNEYSIIRITAASAEKCENMLFAQMSDGIFENSNIGKIEEIEVKL